MGYKLNQVQGALYELMARSAVCSSTASSDVPPLAFRNQIKRLMEIDRDNQRRGSEPSSLPAFFANESLGKGNSASYDAAGVYRLGLALELVRFGFKQREVVTKITSIRDELDAQYRIITKHVRSSGSSRQVIDAGTAFPRKETRHASDKTAVDVSTFLVIDPLEHPREESANLYADAGAAPRHHVAKGWPQLQRYLKGHLQHDRLSAYIVDLTEIALRTSEFLEHQAPGRAGAADGRLTRD